MLVLPFSTQKADVTWKKKVIQTIEKYRVVDKQLRERLELGNAYIYGLHYRKDDIEFRIKMQFIFLYFLCLFLRLKSRILRGASHHPAFMGYSPTISYTC